MLCTCQHLQTLCTGTYHTCICNKAFACSSEPQYRHFVLVRTIPQLIRLLLAVLNLSRGYQRPLLLCLSPQLSLPGQPLPSRLRVEVSRESGDPDLFLSQTATAPTQKRCASSYFSLKMCQTFCLGFSVIAGSEHVSSCHTGSLTCSILSSQIQSM